MDKYKIVIIYNNGMKETYKSNEKQKNNVIDRILLLDEVGLIDKATVQKYPLKNNEIKIMV